MSSKENRDLVLLLYKRMFHGPAADLERMFASDYKDHSLWGDLDGLKQTLAHLHDTLPNLKWRIEDIVAEKDKVVARGSILVMAAHGPIRKIRFIHWFRIRDGKIAEQWGSGDPLLVPPKPGMRA